MASKQAITLLLIDDVGEFRTVMVKLLAEFGYNTILAANGREGIELFQAHPVDAVLLDFNLPDLYGMEILERLIFAKPSVPVIMISAYGSTEIAKRAKQLGAYEFINKPFNVESLHECIEQALIDYKIKKTVIKS